MNANFLLYFEYNASNSVKFWRIEHVFSHKRAEIQKRLDSNIEIAGRVFCHSRQAKNVFFGVTFERKSCRKAIIDNRCSVAYRKNIDRVFPYMARWHPGQPALLFREVKPSEAKAKNRSRQVAIGASSAMRMWP
jgi:hypothetical protein